MGDDRTRQEIVSYMREIEHSNRLFNPLEKIIANNFVAMAKKLVSPYFGANDFAFAYAHA